MAKQRIPVWPKNATLKRLSDIDPERFAMAWWKAEGSYIDPDTDDVDWFNKRQELAGMAYIAGYKRAIEESK